MRSFAQFGKFTSRLLDERLSSRLSPFQNEGDFADLVAEKLGQDVYQKLNPATKVEY